MDIMTALPAAAPPQTSPEPRVWASTAMLLGSLAFVFLAGCFLLGVFMLVNPELFTGPCPDDDVKPVTLTAEQRALMFTLYGVTSASFLASAVLFALGVRGLCSVLWGKDRRPAG
jgi:hypothetical protein